MRDLTIVYYSASTEPPAFEARVQEQILKASAWPALPLISVTQRPARFGQNVCVGNVGCCDANAFRQLQIGALLADTPWIAVAEADALYPPAYFDFRPPAGATCIRYVPVYVLWNRERRGFKQKEWTEGAQYLDREFLLRRLDRALAGRREWSSPDDPHPPELIRKRRWGYRSEPAAPVVTCKTGRGLRWETGTIRGIPRLWSLPYWGRCSALRARFFGGQR